MLKNKAVKDGLVNKERLLRFFKDNYALVILVVLLLFFSLIEPRFRTMQNYIVIGRQGAIVAIVAFSSTFVITAKEIDLSAGAVATLTSMCVAIFMQANYGTVLSSFMGIGVGLLAGFLNGLLTTKARVPSFLVTLGMLGVCDGLSRSVTDTPAVAIYDKSFSELWNSGSILGIPMIIIWLALFYILSVFVYNYTNFGSYVKATGGNRIAAQFSGIKTDRIIIAVMTISGAFASLSGLFLTARMNQGRPDLGSGLGLDAVTAVVLGGTMFTGGKGSVFCSLMGALILATLQNALIILGLTAELITIVKGAIIIAAVAASSRRKN